MVVGWWIYSLINVDSTDKINIKRTYNWINVDSTVIKSTLKEHIIESTLIHSQNWLRVQHYFNVEHNEQDQRLINTGHQCWSQPSGRLISQHWFNHFLLSGEGLKILSTPDPLEEPLQKSLPLGKPLGTKN